MRPLAIGDRVMLLDAKKRRYLVTLADGGEFHSHAGFVPHADIAGQSEGVVVRSVWDYQHHRPQFLAWAERVAGATPLWNPVEVLRWNTAKDYRIELRSGCSWVPTVALESGSPAALTAELDGLGWGEVVIKPRVGASGADTWRWRVGDDLPADVASRLAKGGLLAQPWLETVIDDGEWSLFYLDGTLSHVARKRARPGEFRVQEDHGGRTELADEPDGAHEVAARALEAMAPGLLYARVDLLRDRRGGWLVSELELTEPSMYLRLAPGAADRFAEAVGRRLG